MKVATWNVNSIRRRIDLVLRFLEDVQPDVLCLQEIKCTDAQFPRRPFRDLGYDVAAFGSGGHGGVAVASKCGLDDVSAGFGGSPRPPFDEPRLLAATVGDIRLVTLYAPNGKRVGTPEHAMKLAWFELLRTEMALELAEQPRLVVTGDFNVCPAPIDVYDYDKKRRSNLVSAPEQAALSALLDLGFADIARSLHPEEPGFSWFSYSYERFEKRLGYRLDLVLASPEIADTFTSCRSLTEWREPDLNPSDHTPVLATRGSGER